MNEPHNIKLQTDQDHAMPGITLCHNATAHCFHPPTTSLRTDLTIPCSVLLLLLLLL
jgi:hypothetical protein